MSVLLLAGAVVHGIEDSERSPRGEATMSNDVDSPLAVYVLVVVLSLIAAVVAMVGSRAAGFVLAAAAVAQVVAIVLLGGLSDPYGIAGIVLSMAALAAGIWFAFDKDAPAPPRRDDDLAQWAAQQRLSGD
ncbi:hypothetical protein [Yimella sp. cx-51]|uniref:hypothetical protein n=1 Tax=Yimella sp. cx-51 TaxID=2770551 RepID=UPI00165E85FD|nr:hypothetical protein [Yimella sp. cx-51]MBC9957210.1 hypothetical protein [Yimella sp. cx-51]MBD2758525.1 hypothetical protein [Yimella sp. cx-573]QTH37143.1 hypothetical protein J5M86_09510 [Yimella sp. cx-51]